MAHPLVVVREADVPEVASDVSIGDEEPQKLAQLRADRGPGRLDRRLGAERDLVALLERVRPHDVPLGIEHAVVRGGLDYATPGLYGQQAMVGVLSSTTSCGDRLDSRPLLAVPDLNQPVRLEALDRRPLAADGDEVRSGGDAHKPVLSH